MTTRPPGPAAYAAACEALRAGEVVAYPTETVYGLAAAPFNREAVEKLFEIKGRRDSNPILLIVAGEEQLPALTRELPLEARRYIDAFWPGPLSLLFPKHPDLPEAITAGSDKVCVRCPGSTIARELCRAFGGAVTSTSANRSGEAPARTLKEAMLEGVAFGIDGGTLEPSAPSTVFDPIEGQVLRAGAIDLDTLLSLWKKRK